MELIYQRCCGIDIHKKILVACLITPGPAGECHKELRTFHTVTADLLNLHDWLQAAGCSHVALESTGVYGKPAYNLLEEDFDVLIVNAQHLKAVKGAKDGRERCRVDRRSLTAWKARAPATFLRLPSENCAS